MGKGKLAKFADMETYENVFQCPYSAVGHALDMRGTGNDWSHEMKGNWHEQYFHNNNPIVLELGCGKGEYAVDLARQNPDKNFIGVDIKGARMWTGATQALNEGLKNVAFLRTNIEIIDRFFAPGEVQEIWLTFSDPQMKNPRKRLTSTWFLERYRRFLVDGAVIHLKTDSNFLFTYTKHVVDHNSLPIDVSTTDLYAENVLSGSAAERALSGSAAENALALAGSIQTYYEQMWRSRGISIKYMKFHLPHSTTLNEPDVEIELDEYRSYHRTKRSSLDKAK